MARISCFFVFCSRWFCQNLFNLLPYSCSRLFVLSGSLAVKINCGINNICSIQNLDWSHVAWVLVFHLSLDVTRIEMVNIL